MKVELIVPKGKAQEAFIWIITILKKHRISFHITGGLAARVYGSTRKLNDIDIEISKKYFEKILPDVKKYIEYGPDWYKDTTWDLYLLMLNYRGQLIDISGIENGKIFDKNKNKWTNLPSYLSKAKKIKIFGMTIPVQNKKDLLDYKGRIEYDSHKHEEDIKSISIRKQ